MQTADLVPLTSKADDRDDDNDNGDDDDGSDEDNNKEHNGKNILIGHNSKTLETQHLTSHSYQLIYGIQNNAEL